MARLLRPRWIVLTIALVLCAAIRLALGSQPTVERTYDAEEEVETPETSAVLPPLLQASGGPYLETHRVMDLALSQSGSRGVVDAHLESVLLMRYADAVRRIGSGWVTSMSPDREVYVVGITGSVSVSRHGQPGRSFARSVCVFDATTGDLIVWGATNRSDVGEDVGSRPPFEP